MKRSVLVLIVAISRICLAGSCGENSTEGMWSDASTGHSGRCWMSLIPNERGSLTLCVGRDDTSGVFGLLNVSNSVISSREEISKAVYDGTITGYWDGTHGEYLHLSQQSDSFAINRRKTEMFFFRDSPSHFTSWDWQGADYAGHTYHLTCVLTRQLDKPKPTPAVKNPAPAEHTTTPVETPKPIVQPVAPRRPVEGAKTIDELDDGGDAPISVEARKAYFR